jgi:hypothetical protein
MITWNNPIPNGLWYVISPLPAAIEFDGVNYHLRIPSIPRFGYASSSLSDCQNEYIEKATDTLVTPVVLEPEILGLVDPPDGSTIAVVLSSGGSYAVGVWSEGAQTLTVTARVIAATQISAWSSLP